MPFLIGIYISRFFLEHTQKYTSYSIFYITCLILEGNKARQCSSEDIRSVAMIKQNDPIIDDGLGVRWKKMISTIYATIMSDVCTPLTVTGPTSFTAWLRIRKATALKIPMPNSITHCSVL